MKKFFLLFAVTAVAGASFFASCDEKPGEGSKEEPFPIGTWHTTYQYFSRTVKDASPEILKKMREREASGAVPEAGSYRLTFNEDGTGLGSGVYPDGTGRYDFGFIWHLSGDELVITGNGSEYGRVFYYDLIELEDIVWSEPLEVEEIIWREYMDAVEKMVWKIEGSAANDMVLSTSFRDRIGVTDVAIWLDETHAHRYTFERIR